MVKFNIIKSVKDENRNIEYWIERFSSPFKPILKTSEFFLIGFHGTSRQRAENIIKQGFKNSTEINPNMLEGYSSQNYEGGLVFLGNNTKEGIRLSTNHAKRVSSSEWMINTGNSWKDWDNFTDNMKKEMNKDAVLLKLWLKPNNYVKDSDISDEMKFALQEIAKKDAEEKGRMSDTGGSILYAFTYKGLSDISQIFSLIDRGVMTSYGVDMNRIMNRLGIDMIDGYEEDSSLVLNNANSTITKMQIMEIN